MICWREGESSTHFVFWHHQKYAFHMSQNYTYAGCPPPSLIRGKCPESARLLHNSKLIGRDIGSLLDNSSRGVLKAQLRSAALNTNKGHTLYIFAGPCPGRVRSWPLILKSNKKQKQHHFEFEIKQNTKITSQIEATTLQLLVFVLSCWIVVVYCSIVVQSLTLGRAVWEPWATTIVGSFTFGGTFFSVGFLALTFSTKKHICHQTDPQKDPKIDPKPGPGPIFVDFVHPLFLMACAVFLIDFTASTCSKTHKTHD